MATGASAARGRRNSPAQPRLADYFPGASQPASTRLAESFADHPERRQDGGSPHADVEFIPTKWRSILSMEMQGLTKTEIASRLGMHQASVSMICRRPAYVSFRERHLGKLDADFFAMKPLALRALERGLTGTDDNTALKAADMWFSGARYQGYDKSKVTGQETLSAEDVVKRLLQVNVQVNIDKD